MLRKISTVLLSLLVVWYAAETVSGERMRNTNGIVISEGSHRQEDEDAHGCIYATAALRKLQNRDITVRFILVRADEIFYEQVTVTPTSLGEKGLLSSRAVFSNLENGIYELSIESAVNAELDYILAEKGDRSCYLQEGESITFVITDSVSTGSAWFILKEQEEKDD